MAYQMKLAAKERDSYFEFVVEKVTEFIFYDLTKCLDYGLTRIWQSARRIEEIRFFICASHVEFDKHLLFWKITKTTQSNWKSKTTVKFFHNFIRRNGFYKKRSKNVGRTNKFPSGIKLMCTHLSHEPDHFRTGQLEFIFVHFARCAASRPVIEIDVQQIQYGESGGAWLDDKATENCKSIHFRP